MNAEVAAAALRATHDAHEALCEALTLWQDKRIGTFAEQEKLAWAVRTLRRHAGALRDQVAQLAQQQGN